ncbi:hypothetical protein [Parasitella parasitica]|uniref:Uncharacterized protein n=1 Tax=Parasitella parasitica TaxID=35722 RepID=A0A0B7MY76_9FUNG|nr:hypothetical protein [Parasitella parasitica]
MQKELGYFGTTLKNTPTLGLIVKSVKICRDITDSSTPFSQEAGQGIDNILKYSTNLEVLGSSSAPFEILMIWSRLLKAADDQYKSLRLFALSDEWSPGSQKSYKLLSLKYKDSLSKLRLYPSALLGYRIHQDVDYCTLKNSIQDFKSLEELQLCGNFVIEDSIITELDSLIDSCLDTVHSLDLRKCNFLVKDDYRGQTKPRSSIRKLKLSDPLLSSSALQYFASKLTALSTFVLTTKLDNTVQSITEKEYSEWWREMTNFCWNIQLYTICIEHFKFADYLYQIKGGAELSNTIANHRIQQETRNITELTMRFGDLNHMQGNYHIDMNQNGSSVQLFGSECSSDFMQTASIPRIFDSLQFFSPRIIRILNMAHSENFENLLQQPARFSLDSNETSSINDWSIFSGVMRLIKNKTGSAVHLDRMFFFDSEHIEQFEQRFTFKDTSISQLKLTNSLFYPNVLSKMLNISKIDNLIFDRCLFMTNYCYQLDIDLPETKLGYLNLNLNRTFHPNSFEHPCRHYTITLVIGVTNLATYTHTINEQHKAYPKFISRPGTPENFLISIKCQEIESLSISGEKIF